MNIKILAGLAISVVGFSASLARADDHGWHGRCNGGYERHGGWDRGGWDHDRRGYGRDRWYGHRDEYREPRWGYGFAPRYYAPRYYTPSYYAPAQYAPGYYAPGYYAPVYSGGWIDDLGVVIQLHLP
jgi:hypothetical protein